MSCDAVGRGRGLQWRTRASVLAALAGVIGASACAHPEARPPAVVKPDPGNAPVATANPSRSKKDASAKGVVVEANLVRTGQKAALVAWILYGTNRSVMWRAAETKNRSGDDFSIEWVARKQLASDWQEARAKGAGPDPDLDPMALVEKEGLMAEYVIVFLARPGWTVFEGSLAQLNLPRFQTFAAKNLVGHRGVHRAMYYPEGFDAYPRIPGAGLPPLSSIDPGKTPCQASRPRIQAAIAAWAAEESNLDGVPLAAEDRVGFARALDRVRGVPPFSERGATWVLRTVADLHAIAGFCAVDEGRWADAQRFLEKTVALDPFRVPDRGELALVYAHEHRLDDAERVIAEALTLVGSNTCEHARLLRRRGYVLIERGKLVEALHAYGQSLELAPGNPTAMHELQVVLRELRARGGADAAEAEGYRPPPMQLPNQTSSCPQ